MSAKGPAKGTATIQRLLDERRKYESWIARLRSAADASAAPVRERVEADYTARMRAVDEELKVHAEAARQLIAERQEAVADLRAREQQALELNDSVLQGLVVAKMALDLNQPDRSQEALTSSISAASKIITDLLGQGQEGMKLVRSMPADLDRQPETTEVT